MLVSWEECPTIPPELSNMNNGCDLKDIKKGKTILNLENCHFPQEVQSNICSTLPAGVCSHKTNLTTIIKTVTADNFGNESCRSKSFRLFVSSGFCGDGSDEILSFPDNMTISCSGTSNLVPDCGDTITEGRATTNIIYFILRMLATMALACVFIILDAQTIQMCKMESEAG